MKRDTGRWDLLRVCAVVLVAAVQPASAWRGEVAGRSLELGGYLETRQVFRVDRSTPGELNRQRALMELRAWLSDALSVEIAASLQNGGPATRQTRAGVYDIDDVFQSVAPAFEVEEAFVRVDGERVRLRLGQIKHAWGALDRFQPTDVINPERFADPVLVEERDRKIGVPSLEATYFPRLSWLPDESSLTLIVVPRYIPYRLPRPGERWFPPNAVPPSAYAIPAELLAPGAAGEVQVPLSLQARNTPPPSFTPGNASYAARLAAHTRGVDYSLYYYRGVQTDPVLEFGAQIERREDLSATAFLAPVFRRIHMWGADMAFTLGRFGIRAEAAFTRGRGFNRDLRSLVDDRDRLLPAIGDALAEVGGGGVAQVDLGPTFAVSDTVQWGAGVDAKVFDVDVLFEVSQTNVLDRGAPLLIDDDETVLLADLRRKLLGDDLTIQLVSIYGASSDYTVLLPRVTYRAWDRVEVRLGYVHLSGRSRTRLGQYRDNDQGFVRLRFYL